MVGSLAVTVDKLSSNVDLMVQDSTLTRTAMLKNTEALTRSKRQNTLLRGALVGCLLIFVGGGLVVWRDHAQSDCVKSWAVATSGRTSKLTTPAADRVTDLYAALGAASGGALKGVTALPSRGEQIKFIYQAKALYPLLIPGSRGDLAKENASQLSSTFYLIVGLNANNSYVDIAHTNPVPDSPFNCSSF